MHINEIIDKLNMGIKNLLEKEPKILKRGLNERLISIELANNLGPLFTDYDINAEYNGDIDKPNDRKALEISKSEIIAVGRKPNIFNL
jgi:hypothetical protein